MWLEKVEYHRSGKKKLEVEQFLHISYFKGRTLYYIAPYPSLVLYYLFCSIIILRGGAWVLEEEWPVSALP